MFLAAMLLSVSAYADYVTGAYVDTDLEVDAPFNGVYDDEANGFMVGYGWATPHKWLFVELSYTDFGDSDNTISDTYENKYLKITETVQGEYEGNASLECRGNAEPSRGCASALLLASPPADHR